jgi:hypothetical protein
MNSFKRKALTCAVLAGLGGVATTAEAVYRNPDGTGMVLIYPYYTVNSAGSNAYNTYISVTNTTSVAKVTKVRFREGRTSAEVLDFNLYLSPNDVWVGAVGPQGTAADSPAVLFGNFETSCTYPAIPAAGQPFSNVAYAGGLDALPGTGLDRTREGYVEIFDMATLTGDLASKVTHTGIGVAPPNCAAMRVDLTGNALLASPTGGLYGEGTIINVASGASMGYKADALDAYRSGVYYADVSTANPQLGLSAAPFSLVLANNRATTDQWSTAAGEASPGAKAVAAVFMHTSVMNDYILDFNTRSNTDWVMTFPGKHEFYTVFSLGTPVAPYTAVLGTAGACEPTTFTFFDRDEQSTTPPPGGFSPQQAGPGPNTGSLCWESTVVSIRNGQAHTSAQDVSTTNPRSGVLGSRNTLAVSVLTSPAFAAGWINMVFTGANATAGAGITSLAGGDLTASNVALPVGQNQGFGLPGAATGVFTPRPHNFTGLPVTGFMVTARTNSSVACTLPSGTAGNCSGNYAGLFAHSYRTTITP